MGGQVLFNGARVSALQDAELVPQVDGGDGGTTV